MKRLNRVISLLLCMVMVLGLLPMNTFAEETSVDVLAVDSGTNTTVVIAGSDYQQSYNSSASPKENTENILAKLEEKYTAVDGFLFGGDYTQSSDSASATRTGKEELQKVVQGVYGTSMNEVYVQGNHDPESSITDGTLSSSGVHDTDDYGVYVINEKDYPWGYYYSADMQAVTKATATALDSYLDDKVVEGYSKPVFVVSHLPLHFTSRTSSQGDGKYAKYLYDVLDEAGDKGLNIIFLFGHNHSSGYDAYLGNASIYLPEGSTITIANEGSSSTYYTDTLSFTYMNYGYVGYVGGSADTTLTMTAFEITDNQVTVNRYSANGLCNLKAAGVTSSGNPSADTSTVASGATIDLTTPVADGTEGGDNSGDTDSGDSGSTDEITGNVWRQTTSFTEGKNYMLVNYGTNGSGVDTYAINSSAGATAVTVQTDGTGAYIVNNDLTLAWTATAHDSYSDGSYVSLVNADNEYFLSVNRGSNTAAGPLQATESIGTYGVWTMADSKLAAKNSSTTSSNKYYTSYTDSQFYADFNTSGYENWVVIFEETDETGTGTGGSSGGGSTVTPEGGDWITISDGSGKIVYRLDKDGVEDDGKEYLIVADSTAKAMNASSGSITDVDVDIVGDLAYVDSEDYGWVFESYGNNGAYYIKLNDAEYLYITYGTLETRSSVSSSSAYRNRFFITNNEDGTYVLARSNSRGTSAADYQVSWNGSKFAENDGQVRLYKYEGVQSAEKLYAKMQEIDGTTDFTFNVTRGTSVEDALKAVMDGVDVLTSASADGSNASTLEDSDNDITWTLDSSYDGTVPGEYAVVISYQGIKLGTAKVIVPEVNIVGYELVSNTGSVHKGASKSAKTGAYIRVNLEDGSSYDVPVTVGMLSNSDGSAVSTSEIGTYENLTVNYNDQTFAGFTLNVTAKSGNNYPEYPNEGAVKVDKTGAGVMFQSTGIAQVEVSASGIPMNQGVDVVIVLDTSSSMTQTIASLGDDRMSVLEPAVDELIQQLQTKREDGSDPDIDIAIANFCGYTGEGNAANGFGTDNLLDDSTKMNTTNPGGWLTDPNGDGWVDVMDLSSTWGTDGNIPTGSGTNYDNGLKLAYDLLAQKQADNGTERQQFVIFMSDGAPYQYNGVYSQGGDKWVKWLLGDYETESDIPSTVKNKEYYAGYAAGNGQEHRIANAIKGDPSESYDIVTFSALSNGTSKLEAVPGLGATMYTIGLVLADEPSATAIKKEHEVAVLKNMASSEELFFDITTAEGLGDAFSKFAQDVLMAAYNARFVDQMGAEYDIQLKPFVDYKGNAVDADGDGKQDTSKIEILSYDIYTRQDYENKIITEDKIGDRKGTYTVLETVTFSDDGTQAFSDKIGDGNENILIDGVICAKTFWYNTNLNGVEIDGIDIPTGINNDGTTTGTTNVLPAETFYWKLGTLQTTELAMRYYVYLNESMEGHREAGSYATNEFATLYYDNYLENPCCKNTVSPVLPWKAANVSYAFYLVNTNGLPVNMDGTEVTFANRVTIVNPTLYKEILLNNDGNVNSLEVISSGVLPDGYALYDEGAKYTIKINSDSTGSWEITKGESVASTYVTDYSDSKQYTNELTANSDNYDYTHTTVWFAVKWEPQALPDTVVIDYGLPVDIHVMTNDMFGNYGKLIGIAKDDVTDNASKSENSVVTTSATGDYGTAEVRVPSNGANESNSLVRYTPADMEMTGYDQFTYSVEYSNTNYTQNNGYYYETVTVIPATTIYYEDDFVDYTCYTWDYDTNKWREKTDTEESIWTQVTDSTYVQGADITQDEDRPGKVNYAFDTVIDANNVYGYDSAYKNCSQYSLGSAMKAHIDYDNYAEASFTFYGTGFDVISLTSNTTGGIFVTVKDANGNAVRQLTVDTYYGYAYEDGEWVTSVNNPNALYQVPVMEVAGLEYGKYTVKIEALYAEIYDHSQYSDNSYDFYLDAIRIYDPANDGEEDALDDAIIENAYEDDQENWPVYHELRNNVIEAAELNTDTVEVNGIVFIDSEDDTSAVANYMNYGPNNELYLDNGQGIVFNLDLSGYVDSSNNSIVDTVQLGIKSVGGETAYKIFDGDTVANKTDVDAITATKVSTATGMYYDITSLKDATIVIYNTGSNILSLTDIKITFKEEPNEVENLFYVSSDVIETIVKNMNTTTFDPKTLEIKTSPSTIVVGNTFTVTVTTSNDVAAIKVNDTMITTYSVDNAGNYVWIAKVKAEAAGEQTLNVIAYNSAGLESDVETSSVTVQSVGNVIRTTIRTIYEKVKSWFNW